MLRLAYKDHARGETQVLLVDLPRLTWSTIELILKEDLVMRRVVEKFSLRLIQFWSPQIFSSDVIWLYRYAPESKWESSEWSFDDWFYIKSVADIYEFRSILTPALNGIKMGEVKSCFQQWNGLCKFKLTLILIGTETSSFTEIKNVNMRGHFIRIQWLFGWQFPRGKYYVSISSNMKDYAQ